MTLLGVILNKIEGDASLGPQPPGGSASIVYQHQFASMTLMHPQHHPSEKEVRSAGA
jgi:hypothetical protein